MSRCEHHQTQMLDHLYGLLERTDVQALEEHLGGCAECRAALARAEAQQRLLADAARLEFAGLTFNAPSESTPALAKPQAILPLPSQPKRVSTVAWRRATRWAAAASILLVASAGIGLPGAMIWDGYAQRQAQVEQAQADRDRLERERQAILARVASPYKEVEKITEEIRQQPQKLQERLARMEDELRDRFPYVTVVGPEVAQPGASDVYMVETRNLNEKPVAAELYAGAREAPQAATKKPAAPGDGVRLEDSLPVQSDSAGRYKVALRPDLPIKELELVAKAGETKKELRGLLQLAPPVYSTHLATDKPMYQPGEVLAFRSLTLERFSLKPTDEDFDLVYTLLNPNGQEIARLEGKTQLQDVQGRVMQGPDGKPLRGVGAGQLPLDPGIKGGEYTLMVAEANNRFPPERRKCIINQYEKPRLNKELEFTGKSYGPGDEVVAACRVTRAEGGQPVGHQPVAATVQIDGKRYDAAGKESDKALALRTDALGSVKVSFKLPASIERGEASLAVNFNDAGDKDIANTETLVKPIPIVLKKLQVEFFPEGGDLIAGVPNRCYFHARTTLDKPAELKGRVVDSDGTTVTRVETFTDAQRPELSQGTGSFEFTPAAGKRYELKIESPQGIEGQYVLPAVKEDGVVLKIPESVVDAGKPIRAILHSGQKQRSLLVGAYCRGRLLSQARAIVEPGKAAEVVLTPESPAGGVFRVTVFEFTAGEPVRPVAERLIYRKPVERLNLSLRANKPYYCPGERANVFCEATDEKGRPVPAVVCLSAVDKSVITMADEKTARAMPTHYFLTTEVRKPEDLEHADFLLGDHPNAPRALDLLLGTQGWRRFAEQDPAIFKEKHGDDAERLLASMGQAPVVTSNRDEVLAEFYGELAQVRSRLEAEQAKQLAEIQQRYDKAQASAATFKKAREPGLRRQAEQLGTQGEAAGQQLLLAQMKVKDYTRDLLTTGLLVMGLAFVVLGCIALLIRRRSLAQATPYYAGSAASFVAVMVLVLVMVLGESSASRQSEMRQVAQLRTEQLTETLTLDTNEPAPLRDGFRATYGRPSPASPAAPGGAGGPPAAGFGMGGRAGGDQVALRDRPLVPGVEPAATAAPGRPGAGGIPAAKTPAPPGYPAPTTGVSAGEQTVAKREVADAKKVAEEVKALAGADKFRKSTADDLAKMDPKAREALGKPVDQTAAYMHSRARFTEAVGDLHQRGGKLNGVVSKESAPEGGKGVTKGEPRAAEAKPGTEKEDARRLAERRFADRDEGKSRAMNLPRSVSEKPPAVAAGTVPAPSLRAPLAEEAERQIRTPLIVREYAHVRSRGDLTRTDFTETLYWHPALVLPGGNRQVSFELSDSVTTFQVVAFGHTLDGRLGVATLPVESRLPFHIEPKLPVEITASDKLDLPLTLANNTGEKCAVQLEMAFEGLSGMGAKAQEQLVLDANQRTRRLYRLQPTKVEGDTRLFFACQSASFAGDSVERVLKVTPDGFPVVGSRSDVLEGVARTEVNLPETWVNGTLKCQLQAYPSMLADLQKGLEGLLREPSGCFEQTSSSNYPNLLILDYLKESDQANPEVARRAKEMLDRGYQRLTTFECENRAKGKREGYEWFGGTTPPHEALTAYGLLQFRDLTRVYDKVDPAMVERTQQFLMSRKDGKGGFEQKQDGHAFGSAPESIVNAYIVWALTESGSQDDVEKELAALMAQAKDSSDPYLLALVANSLLNRSRAAEARGLLDKLAAAQKKPEGCLAGATTSITRSGGRDLQIETTALALLAWLKANRPEYQANIRDGVKWLGQQRGGYGGFGSTQSTILALKALIAHAKANKKTAEAGELVLWIGGRVVARKSFPAGVQEAIVLELPDPERTLKPGTNDVRVELTGQNVFPYTLTWSYQTLKPISAEDCPVQFKTRLDRAAAVEGDTVRLSATLANASGQGQGMAVAIIGLPAGLTLPEDMKQLKEARDRGVISFWETRGRELILYWRELAPQQKIDVNLDLICRIPGEYSGPASRAYLYYNADHKCWADPLKLAIRPKKSE